jgi:hypothetical protein
MSKKNLTTQEFIERARNVHGLLYDYSKSSYTSAHEKVLIIDPEYGEFWQTPASHLSGRGNPVRASKVRADRLKTPAEDFISQANKVHGGLYDYSLVNYVNTNEKVTIIDPEFGTFEQTPKNHLNGSGSPYRGNNTLSNTAEFISKARKIHGDLYDYSQVEYTSAHVKVVIIDPEYGSFEKTPAHHLSGQGHPKRGLENIKRKRRLSYEDFVERAKLAHGDLYDYSKVDYVNAHTKVVITDPKHGDFSQTPSNHIYQRQGSPDRVAVVSQPHQKLIDWLTSIGETPAINDRTILNRKELDLVIGKLAIEVNGVYWHSSLFFDKQYHQNKYNESCNAGITLLQFYDFEINKKWDIVTSMILSKLGKTSQKIYARKCSVVTLPNDVYREFLESNHLQGAKNSKTRLGLVHDDELVAVLGLSIRGGKQTIDRFSSKIHVTVVGGFSKLLSRVEGCVRTHSANRYATGEVYKKQGFSLVYEHPYTLAYTNGSNLFTRETFQKQKLKSMRGYSDEKTADEILSENGIYPVYGAGTKTWERKESI